jgi:alkylhydroperoxidase family enzyme
MGLIQALFGSLALSHRTREIVTLATAELVESEYELVQHVPLSEAAGVDEATRACAAAQGVRVGTTVGARPRQGTVRGSGHRVAVGTRRDLRSYSESYNDREIVEIMQVVGFYWSLGRFLTVLDLEIAIPAGTANFDAVVKLGQADAGSVATPVTAEGTRPDRADR